jgi:adenylate cyclase class IV
VDRYSEVEVKYSASMVPITRYQQVMAKLFEHQIEREHTVIGWDTFFSNPETGLVLRYRRAKSEGNDHPVLTYKKRKAVGQDSVDRHEIDLFLERNDHTDEDAKAFITTALGCQEHFSILKESYIHHTDDGATKAIIALYDVMVPPDLDTPSALAYQFLHGAAVFRFLEIEIDKDSTCSQDSGQWRLELLQTKLEKALPIGKPLGKSLYELIGPTIGAPKLYIPGTF